MVRTRVFFVEIRRARLSQTAFVLIAFVPVNSSHRTRGLRTEIKRKRTNFFRSVKCFIHKPVFFSWKISSFYTRIIAYDDTRRDRGRGSRLHPWVFMTRVRNTDRHNRSEWLTKDFGLGTHEKNTHRLSTGKSGFLRPRVVQRSTISDVAWDGRVLRVLGENV